MYVIPTVTMHTCLFAIATPQLKIINYPSPLPPPHGTSAKITICIHLDIDMMSSGNRLHSAWTVMIDRVDFGCIWSRFTTLEVSSAWVSLLVYNFTV